MRSRVALIPKLMSQMWEQMERPHRLFDQHFGLAMHPESFFTPMERKIFRDMQATMQSPYTRPWADFYRDERRGWSDIKDDKDKFHVALDVQQFKPEEINVKIVDNYIVVEGKHEEKQDDHGIISRHFVRKYMIPEQCDPEKAASTLSEDGILSITAPRKPESVEQKREKVLKIEKIGKQAIENKKEESPEIAESDNKKMAQSQ